MITKENYGWDSAGNCLWCGEAGRCQCDHTRLVEDISRKVKALPDMIEALQWTTKVCDELLRDGDKREKDMIDKAKAALEKAGIKEG